MSDNHVPPALRKALSSNVETRHIIDVNGAEHYNGATVEMTRLSQTERRKLEEDGVHIGSVSGSPTSSHRAIRVHMHV